MRGKHDVRRAIADGSISFWLSLLQLEEGTEQRVAAHLQELAQTPPTPVPHDLPDEERVALRDRVECVGERR